MSGRNIAGLFLSHEDGAFGVDLKLNHDPSKVVGELLVPTVDILALALAQFLLSAHDALEESIQVVHDAYSAMRDDPDPANAVKTFNETIGLEVYSVQQP